MTGRHPAVEHNLLGRLHRAALAHENPDRRVPVVFVISGADVVALNDYVRQLCQSEETCSVCAGRICDECRIGDPVACVADPDVEHHSDCQDGCDACVASSGRDAKIARIDRPRP